LRAGPIGSSGTGGGSLNQCVQREGERQQRTILAHGTAAITLSISRSRKQRRGAGSPAHHALAVGPLRHMRHGGGSA
jgi:hypothetical protein